MIEIVISAERGTSEAGIVFLHTARKYRFECMRGVFGSHSGPKFSLFYCLSCPTFHLYFGLFEDLKKCPRSRLYGIYSHFLLAIFL